MDEEVPLDGGAIAAVVRVGDTVRRSTGCWTPEVHAVLRYLEAVGCELAPRLVGIDERGREIVRAGAFVAELHAALPRHEDGTLTLHGDLGTVERGCRRRPTVRHRRGLDAPRGGSVGGRLLPARVLHLWAHRAIPPADAVRRMRAFAAGYGVDEALATAMGLMPARLLEVSRFVHQRAEEGVPGFARDELPPLIRGRRCVATVLAGVSPTTDRSRTTPRG